MKRPYSRTYSQSRRRQQERSRDRRGWLLIASSVVALVLLAGFGVAASRTTAISPETGCPKTHRMPTAHTIVLLDETDRLSPTEVRYAQTVIADEYHWLPVGGRLTVRNIVADPSISTDIVICRMDDGSKILGLMKNPRQVQKQFEKYAGSKLKKLLKEISDAPVQEYSPIVETVTDTLDQPDFGRSVEERRLILISDMAQHSTEFTQYGASLRAKDLEEFNRDIEGVSVRIHYISRRGLSLQGARHKAFWKGYFTGMGAQDVHIGHDPLLGEDPTKREVWNETD